MNNIIKGFCIIFGTLWMVSCSDLTFWNEFLDNQPESSGATTEIMFSSKENADKVLTQAYMGLLYGISTSEARMGGNVLESLTDLCHSYRNNIGDGPVTLYYNGQLSPNSVTSIAAYLYGGLSDWKTIRYAWLFIENVDKVPDYSSSEKSKRVAEAKVLIALSYFRMMRYVGGVPWLDHAIDVNEPMNFPRQTFETTVNNIVKLLEDAIPYLDWKQDQLNDGRMTRAGAMGLKVQVLLWAASPTFNSDTKWHPEADEYTCYGNYSKARWERAETAAQDFFTELDNKKGYSLILPEEGAEDMHRARRLAYRKAYYDRGGTEVLISIRKGYQPSILDLYYSRRYYISPTLNYVDMFPWEDGSDFPEDFDWENPSKQPFFTEGDLKPTRDPRLYETVACPGETYYDGNTAPVYTNHQDYKAGQGFLIMKFVLQEASDRSGRPVQWPYLRLPEIMLGYAEILNELYGPTSQAQNLVNEVRARVGLSAIPDNMDNKQFLETIIKERALELGFEEVRWFDLVRRGRKDDFTKQLYNLSSAGNHLNHPTKFTFKKIKLDVTRYWVDHWDTKWYLTPIPQNEINKKYGMTQNPGW